MGFFLDETSLFRSSTWVFIMVSKAGFVHSKLPRVSRTFGSVLENAIQFLSLTCHSHDLVPGGAYWEFTGFGTKKPYAKDMACYLFNKQQGWVMQ